MDIIIHTRNLQVLATEMFKVYKNLSPTIVAEFFIIYVRTVYHGSESLSNSRLRIWNLVPSALKKLDDVNLFKTQMTNCPSWLCKTYIPHVGFI